MEMSDFPQAFSPKSPAKMPKWAGAGMDIMGKAYKQGILDTPERGHRRRSSCCGLSPAATPATPQKRQHLQDTPPPAPQLFQNKLRDDIDEAILHGSMPLLSLALIHGHRCSGYHPVYEAVHHQHLGALEFLLRNGYPADEVCCGRRPLHLAMQCCMIEGDAGQKMAELLLKYGARPNYTPGDDLAQPSPLHNAVQRCCAAATELLLVSGADPRKVDAFGNTPLHLACRQARLLGGAAQPRTAGDGTHRPDAAATGRTPEADTHRSPCMPQVAPLQVAPLHTSFQERVVGLLLRHGANPSQGDAGGLPASMFVSTHDSRLRTKLAQAERWFNRCGLRIICANLGIGRTPAHTTCTVCLSQPDTSGTIIDFL